MSIRSRIFVVIGTWVALTAAALVAGLVAWHDRLPDPIASHWGLSGTPNGAMPFGAFLAVVLALWAVVAASGIAVLARGSESRQQRGIAFSALGTGAVFVIGLELLTVQANLDVPDWHQARSPGWQLAPHLALSALFGWFGWLLGRVGPHVEPEPPNGDELDLGSDERAVWVSQVSSRVLTALGGGAVVAGLAGGIAGAGLPFVAPSALVGLACLAFSSARVHIDERGVRTALGPLRWPVRKIRLEHVDSARAETRNAWEVGGWGYRMRPGTTAVMLRSGECLVLRLVSGREFVLSVDHAQRGAELLNALLAERSAL